MTIDDEIDFIGKWGLGKEYKNYVNLYSDSGKEYRADFLYSKPDDKEIKIKWPLKENDIEIPKLSKKDSSGQSILKAKSRGELFK